MQVFIRTDRHRGPAVWLALAWLFIHVPASASAQSDWPTHLHDNARTGFNPLEATLGPPLTEVWRFPDAGLFRMQPIVVENRVFAIADFFSWGGVVGDNRLYALDLESGDLIWETDLGDDERFNHRLTAYQGVLYFTSTALEQENSGTLYAASAENGQILWTLGISASLFGGAFPIVDDGIIYFVDWDQTLYAVDAATRDTIWTYASGSNFGDSHEPTIVNGTLIYGRGGDFFALDKGTGAENWRQDWPGSLRAMDGGVLTGNPSRGAVYVVASVPDPPASVHRLHSFDVESGALQWSFSCPQSGNFWGFVQPVVAGDDLYFHCPRQGGVINQIYKLDPATGAERSSFSFPDTEDLLEYMTLANGVLYLTSDNAVFAFDAETGDSLWQSDTGIFTFSGPVIAAGGRAFRADPTAYGPDGGSYLDLVAYGGQFPPVAAGFEMGSAPENCDGDYVLPVVGHGLSGTQVSSFDLRLTYDPVFVSLDEIRLPTPMSDWQATLDPGGWVHFESPSFPEPGVLPEGAIFSAVFHKTSVNPPADIWPVVVTLPTETISGFPMPVDGTTGFVTLGTFVDPVIHIGAAVGSPGGHATLPVSIENLCDAGAPLPLPHRYFELELALDEEGLGTPEASLDGTVIPDWELFAFGALDFFRMEAQAGPASSDLQDGVIAYLTFPIHAGAAAGEYAVTVSHVSIEATPIVVIGEAGRVEVEVAQCATVSAAASDPLWSWDQFASTVRNEPPSGMNRDCVPGHYAAFVFYRDELTGELHLKTTAPLTYDDRDIFSELEDIVSPPGSDPACVNNTILYQGWVSYAEWGALYQPPTGPTYTPGDKWFAFTTQNFPELEGNAGGDNGRVALHSELISDGAAAQLETFLSAQLHEIYLPRWGLEDAQVYFPNYPEPLQGPISEAVPTGLVPMKYRIEALPQESYWRLDARWGRTYRNAPDAREPLLVSRSAENFTWTQAGDPVHFPGRQFTGLYAMGCGNTWAMGYWAHHVHSELWGGAHVRGAGQIVTHEGELCYLDNASGHYRPTAQEFESFVSAHLSDVPGTFGDKGNYRYFLPGAASAECRALAGEHLGIDVRPEPVHISGLVGRTASAKVTLFNHRVDEVDYVVFPVFTPWLEIGEGEVGTLPAGGSLDVTLEAQCTAEGTRTGNYQVYRLSTNQPLTSELTVILDCVAASYPSSVALSGGTGSASGSFVLQNLSESNSLDFQFPSGVSASILPRFSSSGGLTFSPSAGTIPALGSQEILATAFCPAEPTSETYAVPVVLEGNEFTLAVTVQCTGNLPPIAHADAYTTAAGEVLQISAPGVLGNDTDPDGDALQSVLETPPQQGVLRLAADGSFVFTAEQPGLVRFTYRASDGLGFSAPAEVLVTVTGDETTLVVSLEDARPVVEPELGDEAESVFRARLSVESAFPVVLLYETEDGSATGGEDYAATRETVTVPAGETEIPIPIPLFGDSIPEPAEDFFLRLTACRHLDPSQPCQLSRDRARAVIEDGDARTNYRSIGTLRGNLYDQGIAVWTGDNRFALRGGSLPENVGVGDLLILDPGPNQVAYFILSRLDATHLSVQGSVESPPSGVRFAIRRAYQALAEWERERDGELVRERRREVGVVYSDGPFRGKDEFALLTFEGSTTNKRYYMKLVAAPGHQHRGVAGTGVVLDGRGLVKLGIQVRDAYTRIEGLELRGFTHGDGAAAVEVRHARHVSLDRLLIHDFANPRASVVGIKGSYESEFTLRNTILYDGDVAGVRINRESGRARVENCTVFGMEGRGIFEDDGKIWVRNTISMGNGRGDLEVARSRQSYNLSSDGTASAAGSIPFAVAEEQFLSLRPGSEDFHLRIGSAAVDQGEDLSERFAHDVEGDRRPQGAGWDIGADERRP